MPNNSKKQKKGRNLSASHKALIALAAGTCVVAGLFGVSRFQYHSSAPNETELDRILRFFDANTSKHHNDPVSSCWYDAGDYIVFLPHQLLATWYLTQAQDVAQTPEVTERLARVIEQSKTCLKSALQQNWKQFRDMSSHGIPLPPWLHERFYPETFYTLNEQEGRDMWMIWKSILEATHAPQEELDQADQEIASRTTTTTTEHCCESGPLSLSPSVVRAFESSFSQPTSDLWGAQPQTLRTLEMNPQIIKDLLTELQKDPHPEERFFYWNGNRDLAGTVALERLYARQTGDQSFRDLSAHFVAFLENKENPWKISFSNDPNLHHPCQQLLLCSYEGFLAAGLDDTHPNEPWRMHEPDLVTQSVYTLASVLWNDW